MSRSPRLLIRRLLACRAAMRGATARVAVLATLAGLAACGDGTTQPHGDPSTLHGVSGSAVVGDTVLLNVRVPDAATADNVGSGAADCGTPNLVKARVAAISRHAIIVADTRNPSPGFSDADYASIGASFDTLVWPVDTRNFGVPTDIDQNGRVVIFYTRTVNGLTPPNADFYVGGFFYSRDLLPTTGAHACPGSNGGELFYALAADPTGTINGNARDADFVRRVTVGTVAHEFQHLINAARRIYVLNEQNYSEEVWLNEGLSHIAEELTFYQSAGLAPAGEPGQSPRARLTGARIRAQPNGITALNNFGLQNLLRFSLYLKATERYAPYTENDSLETRGATWSLLRYAADWSGGTDSAFFYSLVNSPTTGVANLRAALAATPARPVLEDVLRDWAVSSDADGLAPGLPDRFTQPSWVFRDVLTTLLVRNVAGGSVPINNGVYPLTPRLLANGASQSLALGGGSVAYLGFTVPASGTATLRTTAGSAAALPATARLAVVQVTGPSAGTVATYDGAVGGSVTVPNLSASPVQAMLVVLNANTTASARQTLTVAGTGLGATGAAVALLAGPTQARLAAVPREPVMSDAAVMRRLQVSSQVAVGSRLTAARAAYAAARRTGDYGAWARRRYVAGTVRGLVVKP